MRKLLVCAGIIFGVSVVGLAPCYNSDSPDCACFDSTATWSPSGTWIQDVALDTVGTVESCVSNGGKPFYQMRMGINGSSDATTMAAILELLDVLGMNPYEREAWCSETISYWHREKGIPYSTGYRNSSWHLDWQLTNTEAIRSFYMIEEILDLLPLFSGRGRWINWEDLDYSDFQPGVTAPAPGSYVLIRKYDESSASWDGNSHSMMINEMTIHRTGSGAVYRVEVTLLDGNAGSPDRVRSTEHFDDLYQLTPAGSEWLDGGRKILGFGIDLNRHGYPIFDRSRLFYETTFARLVRRERIPEVHDPFWDAHYAPLLERLVEYAKTAKDGVRVTGPSAIVGRGQIPDGRDVSWSFAAGSSSQRMQKDTEIMIDLVQEHPLPLKGLVLRWAGSWPRSFEIHLARANQRAPSITRMPDLSGLNLPTSLPRTMAIPVSFGKESVSVRTLKLVFPPDAFAASAKLVEIQFLYDCGPTQDAELGANPGR
ncbi:MAG: hypothetical protein JSW65_05170 [Candidatus Bipolaricaulota bacterium]|nr:MAG: hypothetical protein JSW65_05170 [Candidatus Bipolaricaulota bacterium]